MNTSRKAFVANGIAKACQDPAGDSSSSFPRNSKRPQEEVARKEVLKEPQLGRLLRKLGTYLQRPQQVPTRHGAALKTASAKRQRYIGCHMFVESMLEPAHMLEVQSRALRELRKLQMLRRTPPSKRRLLVMTSGRGMEIN